MSQVDELIRSLELPGVADGAASERAERDARERLRAAVRAAGAPGAQEHGGLAGWTRPARRSVGGTRRGLGSRGHRRRARGPLLPAAALACALAAVLAVVFAFVPSGGGRGSGLELGVGQATAQEVLARAARIAAVTPPSTVPDAHQFLYTKWIVSWTGVAGYQKPAPAGSTEHAEKRYVFADTTGDTEQDWEAPNGSGRQKTTHGFAHFLTAADRAAWRAAGRPDQAQPDLDGAYPRGAYFSSCGRIPPRGPAGLSTNPSRLLKQVIHRYEGGHYGADATLSTAACILVTSAYAPLRAATYRMLGHVPGITLLGRRRDGIGRRGIALGVPDPKQGTESVVLLDPVTARPLELEDIQTRVVPPPPARPGVPVTPTKNLPNGTVLNSQILLASGVVNSEEALPGGGSVPFKRPPVIRVSAPAVPTNPRQPVVETLAGLRTELAILRRPQVASDRLTAQATRAERQPTCSNCLNISRPLPSATRLLTRLRVRRDPYNGKALTHAWEDVYLVVGSVANTATKRSPEGTIPTAPANGWHQPDSADSKLHLSIVGFVPNLARVNAGQPMDTLLNPAAARVPTQTLTPADVMIGQFGTVGVVPDGVTRVRWELINPGQSRPVTVYPTVRGNVATAPLTPSHGRTGLATEQSLASAVWYGAGGRVIASVNLLPALVRASGQESWRYVGH